MGEHDNYFFVKVKSEWSRIIYDRDSLGRVRVVSTDLYTTGQRGAITFGYREMSRKLGAGNEIYGSFCLCQRPLTSVFNRIVDKLWVLIILFFVFSMFTYTKCFYFFTSLVIVKLRHQGLKKYSPRSIRVKNEFLIHCLTLNVLKCQTLVWVSSDESSSKHRFAVYDIWLVVDTNPSRQFWSGVTAIKIRTHNWRDHFVDTFLGLSSSPVICRSVVESFGVTESSRVRVDDLNRCNTGINTNDALELCSN